MPVYLKQWIDGNFTIVYAKDLDDAVRILNQTVCVDEKSILQLNAGDMSATFTLNNSGELICEELTPAIAEARKECFPELMRALKGMNPSHITHPDHKQLVENAVDDELKTESTRSSPSASSPGRRTSSRNDPRSATRARSSYPPCHSNAGWHWRCRARPRV